MAIVGVEGLIINNVMVIVIVMWQRCRDVRTQRLTRSQAIARIADRTASQHLRGSRDVIGHVTI